MKSFCIKTNHSEIINYLLEQIENLQMEHIYLSCKQFKIHQNVIIHYSGEETALFLNQFCEILSDTILAFYEKKKLKEILNLNYFYFSDFEKQDILNHCNFVLEDEKNMEAHIRKEYLYVSLLKYVNENKSMILDGFVNFRLEDYFKVLDFVIDTSVNEFLIEREYNEFIHLLKIYIDSNPTNDATVHLIYTNGESILLDEKKDTISVNENLLNAKYLSDISFSSNDFALNALLNLLPKRIIIHLIDQEDEFIQTLKLIFDNRIMLCRHCSLCTSYRMLEKNKGITK